MNILILTQYFKPETFIINELVLEMEKLGHTITVLTGKPNYPEGKIFEGFRIWGIQRENYGENIEVFRVPLLPRGHGRAINLILNYISFVISATLLGPFLLRKKKFDLIFTFAVSPITVAIPGLVMNLFKKAFFVLWVQDLWPESLIVTKYVKNKFILNAVEWMVKVIYKGSDLILVQSKAFFEPITRIYAKAEIEYYPNSFRKYERYEDSHSLPEQLESILVQNFSVVFAGNIGKAQSVETIVESAKKLKNISNLKIVFVGSGSSLAWIQEEKKRFNLDNIECVGRFDLSVMPLIYSKAKLMLLTLNSDDILKYTLPWKTQSYLAAGKPILGAIDGEGARIILESDCGFVGKAEDAEELANNIRRAMNLSTMELEKLGKNGLAYFEKHFEMQNQTKKLFQLIENHNNK